jgi:hypothetical protein
MSEPNEHRDGTDDDTEDAPRTCASPPCLQHELDPSYGLDDRYPILNRSPQSGERVTLPQITQDQST